MGGTKMRSALKSGSWLSTSSKLALLALAYAGSAHAAEQGERQLEEIVVTAQRTEQRLQDVPISISAVAADAALRKGVTSSDMLTNIVPSLVFTSVGNNGAPYLRGIGSNNPFTSSEAPVATYVDGVYIAAPNMSIFEFNNIERIEVLKGPQGTLFGRNATGGVIQIITRDPSHNPSSHVSLGYASYETVSASFYGTSPLTSKAAADLAVNFSNQGKGWGRNLTTGKPTFTSKSFSVRSKLLYELGEDTTARLAVDYSNHSGALNNKVIAPGSVGLDGIATYAGDFNSRSNSVEDSDRETGGISLRLDHDFGAVRGASITAYRESFGRLQADNDATALNISAGDFRQVNQNFSQEFHLMSPIDSRVTWLVGAYYFDAKGAYPRYLITGSSVGAPGNFLNIVNAQYTKSYSAFAQGTAEIMPRTNLTLGFRYTTESQSADIRINNQAGVLVPRSWQKQKYSRPTWRISLDHKLSEDSMIYASYNRGIKSGGYNVGSANGPPYKPESLDAYEAGIKSELLNSRLRLNASAFYYDYKDMQLRQTYTNSVFILNAGHARIKGADIDVEWIATDMLTLNAAIGLLDGEYISFPGATFVSPIARTPSVVGDASGKRTVQTPKVTANIGFTYDVPLSSGSLILAANANYNSGFYWQASNISTQSAYTVVNASITWLLPGDRYSLRLWGKNITDTAYYSNENDAAGVGHYVSSAPPATVGVTVSAKFP